MLKNIFSILAGLLSAFVVMMIFEYINSLIFPFPENFAMSDLDAVQQFSKTLPDTAYILVLLGWAAGSFLAGWVAQKISKNDQLFIPLMLSALLTLLGVINFLMLAHPVWMLTLGIFVFIGLPFIGFKTAKSSD